MSFDVELIILHYTRFGENSLVLHTLSREYGRRGFILRVGKNTSMASFLPLNVVEARVSENPKSSLWRASDVKVLYPLNGIRGNIYKNSMTMFMSEVLYRVIKDGANEEGLFDWCLSSIVTLDSLESDFSNYHIRFLMELCSSLGFSPSVQSMAPFAKRQLSSISRMLTLSLSESMLVPLTGDDRNEMCEEILDYLEYYTESAINVRSLAVLKELFH